MHGRKFHRYLWPLVVLLCWSFIPAAGAAKHKAAGKTAAKNSPPKTTAITGFGCFSSERYTRFVINLSKIPEYSHGFIPGNDTEGKANRIYIDLAKSELATSSQNDLTWPSGPITGLRIGRQRDNSLRLVLDLNSVQQYKITALQNPTRLAVDLYNIATADSDPTPAVTLTAENTLPVNTPKKKKSSWLIVLDPGHGGDDTGAVGPSGLQEKNVALEIALALRDILLQHNNIDVLLTRTQDRELALGERSALANHQQADLFISIHNNAGSDRSFNGLSTYYLNNADDRFSQRLATVENNSTSEELNLADLVINDLKMNKITISSQKLAKTIQSSTFAEISAVDDTIRDHGVKTALFYVLLGAKMPAVLVEGNFISNPHEETLLANPSYREKLATGISKGILAFIEEE